MKKVFPQTKAEKKQVQKIEDDTKAFWPDKAIAKSVFDKNINEFKKSPACARVHEMARKSFEKKNCNKIVAFGGSSMFPGAWKDSELVTRFQTQHAFVLELREVWRQCNKGAQDLPIYIQDPAYYPLDE